jgi:hypothetical protein
MGEIAVGLAKSPKARAKLVSFFPAKSPIREQLVVNSCSCSIHVTIDREI